MAWPPLNSEEVVGEYPDSESMKRIMSNLQANILKAHGRDQACHILLRFKVEEDEDRAAVKEWIERITTDYVTSAQTQFDDSLKRRDNRSYSGGLLGCFFLSVSGYKSLFPKKDELRKLARAFQDSAFENGMKKKEPGDSYTIPDGAKAPGQKHRFPNKDPMPKDWEDFYQGDIHAMLLLAQDCRETKPSLEDKVYEIIKEFGVDKKDFEANGNDFDCEKIVETCHLEYGRRQLSQEGYDYEHFGFRDGISNPVVFKDEIERKKGKFFNPGIPLERILVKDPYGCEEYCFGSFFVFRKLEQNIRDFESGVEKLSKMVNKGYPKRTRAQVVGRFENGTPITAHKKALTDTSSPEVNLNDFNYSGDYAGRRCPQHSHIRRVNPRNKGVFNRPIVRRGIPYEESNADNNKGLLFMCYQNSIHEQFEFIQRVWIDDVDQPSANAGHDPLIGQDKSEDAGQSWFERYDDNAALKRPFKLDGYVTLKGGEYFFAPSISYLKNIA